MNFWKLVGVGTQLILLCVLLHNWNILGNGKHHYLLAQFVLGRTVVSWDGRNDFWGRTLIIFFAGQTASFLNCRLSIFWNGQAQQQLCVPQETFVPKTAQQARRLSQSCVPKPASSVPTPKIVRHKKKPSSQKWLVSVPKPPSPNLHLMILHIFVFSFCVVARERKPVIFRRKQ